MYLGFDIGGSSIKAALVQNRKIVGTRFERLPKSFNQLVKTITDIKKDFTLNKSIKIKGIGFSIAGALDKKRENMLFSINIPYLSGKNLSKKFSQELKPYPIKIERDAYCFLIADSIIGKGKKHNDIFYLTLGTGIGGALMINRKIITGQHGSAGEVGHTIVDMENETHWEDIAANKFIQKELGIRFTDAKEQASNGDKKALKLFKQLGINIGIGIANSINSFDPGVIILSGGLASAKDLILPGIKQGVEKYVVSEDAKKTKILWSDLGRFGGALGAALLFDQEL